MDEPWRWIVLIAALVGHFGLHLAFYNRINAFGWPRKVIKSIVKLAFVEMWLTLAAAIWWGGPAIIAWLQGSTWQSIPAWLLGYGSVCLLTWPLFGLPWLMWRPVLGWEGIQAKRRKETVHVPRLLGRDLARTGKCRIASTLPLNQMFQLSIEQIDLPVPGLPKTLDGYRIAQLTDIHLTGNVSPDFTRYAVERAAAWQPDMMAITGDIIDRQPCIDWLADIFAPAQAFDGCYFILGNHDTRVVDSWQTREAMDSAGWTDLGSRILDVPVKGTSIQLIGNEWPWFDRPSDEAMRALPSGTFKLLFSHSPDQIWWARRHGIQLMLAGHTHGGQGRLPLAGPLLSPSWHGSRFASGDFYKAPTTLHVSRGLAGVHLMRINCRPELSLLTLRTAACSPRPSLPK